MAPSPLRRSPRIKRKGDEAFENDEQNGVVHERTPTSNKKQRTQKTAKPVTKKQPQGGKKKWKSKGKETERVVKDKVKSSGALDISDDRLEDYPGLPTHLVLADVDDNIDNADNVDYDGLLQMEPDDAPSPSPVPPEAPPLTDAYVRSLLPGSMFGLADDLFARGLWSVAHEHALRHQQFAASPDFARFQEEQIRMFQAEVPANTQGPFDAELRLWEVLQHRFRCGLDDLFRYGLRPDLRRSGFVDYCVKLTAILVHPLWSTNIAPVRWLLQRIVQERVPGHARPLVPPYSYDRQPFADTARQWGFDASMRMSLAELEETSTESESESESSKTRTKSTTTTTTRSATMTTQRDDNNLLSHLAAASREAASAAAEAEAELAWFFFAASAPRDLWYLDRQLMHLYEPGSGEGEDVDEVDVDEEDQKEGDGDGDGGNPFDLKVCDDILQGYFGALAPSYDEFEVTERQEIRRREDNLVYRTGRQGRRDNSETRDGLRNDQVFFDLRTQDLDRLLRLLALPDFCDTSGFVTPGCYYGGYIKAHAIHGYGEKVKGEEGQQEEPLLTCLQCAQKYHQSGGPEEAIEDSDDEHDHDHGDEDEDEDEDGHAAHTHHLHQQFVRDVDPERALEWLLQRKCEWLLAGCREQLIRASLKAGEGFNKTLTEKERALLPDIPPFDPPPLAWLDRVFTHPSQLAVLERAQNVPHASVMWCLGDDDEEVEEN